MSVTSENQHKVTLMAKRCSKGNRDIATSDPDILEDTCRSLGYGLRLNDEDHDSKNSKLGSGSEEGSNQAAGESCSQSKDTKILSSVPAIKTSNESSFTPFIPPENWVNAPEFVPKLFVPISTPATRSYAEVVGTSTIPDMPLHNSSMDLCPYAMMGECRFGEKCAYLHGLKCDFCGMLCLHPFDPDQREKHSRECIEQHEKDMELSFAIARSSDKTCGICMEVVMEKNPPGEQRFGILPACVHCYCLSCIRKWRQARHFENKIIRACPECRTKSDYVCPSRYWVETKEEKDKLINSYLDSLSKKHCRYYRKGAGECPFGNKCFYLHALPNGNVVDVGPPKRRVRRENGSGVASGPERVSIYEFLERWELQWYDIEDLMDLMDSDDTSTTFSQDDEDGFDDLEYFSFSS